MERLIDLYHSTYRFKTSTKWANENSPKVKEHLSSFQSMLEKQEQDLNEAIAKKARQLLEESKNKKSKSPPQLAGDSLRKGIGKSAVSQLMNETENKTKQTPLDAFLTTYNAYLKKLMWVGADPYLSLRYEKHLNHMQAKAGGRRPSKFANVFNRLDFDIAARKQQKEGSRKQSLRKTMTSSDKLSSGMNETTKDQPPVLNLNDIQEVLSESPSLIDEPTS